MLHLPCATHGKKRNDDQHDLTVDSSAALLNRVCRFVAMAAFAGHISLASASKRRISPSAPSSVQTVRLCKNLDGAVAALPHLALR